MNTFLILPLLLGFAAPETEEADRQAVLSDYKSVLNQLDHVVGQVTKEENYKGFSLKKGEESIGFEKLTPVDKKVFYLFQFQRFSNTMYKLELEWEEELKQATDKEITDEEAKDLSRPPTVKQIKEQMALLTKLRQTHAEQFEDYLNSFKDEEIPQKEIEAYKASLVKWHDEHKLINRD